MPSPFPGMDPYLEDPNHWGNVHHGLIGEIQAQLNAKVRPRYVVRVEERVYVVPEDDPSHQLFRVPDVKILRGRRVKSRAGAVASAVATAPVELATITTAQEVREDSLVITDTTTRKVVTVIEVMSPTNKLVGSIGRDQYLRKRHEVLNSPTHWVEIDLLRSGTPPVADRWAFDCDYLVHVSRSDRRPLGWVWPISLRDRLPVVTAPLEGADENTNLDLQAVLDAAYDRGAFDSAADYRHEATPPLSPSDAAWARRLLRAAGLRK